jgi:hypothetical protein
MCGAELEEELTLFRLREEVINEWILQAMARQPLAAGPDPFLLFVRLDLRSFT